MLKQRQSGYDNSRISPDLYLVVSNWRTIFRNSSSQVVPGHRLREFTLNVGTRHQAID